MDDDASQIQNATLDAWQTPFNGQSAEALWDHICSFTKRPYEWHRIYALYTFVVQSSGTGKSRCVDELSKTHFVIPINLHRSPNGFPPADSGVLDFLTKSSFSFAEVYKRMVSFLYALFDVTVQTLRTLDPDNIDQGMDSVTKYARLFREFMSKGQTWIHHGAQRVDFYSRVIDKAIDLRRSNTIIQWGLQDAPGKAITGAFNNLLRHLYNIPPESTSATKLPRELISGFAAPLVILAFDEAQTLTRRLSIDGDVTEIHFQELRRALRHLSERRIHSLFLSTVGPIPKVPKKPTAVSSSSRLEQGEFISLPPFTRLGFDQFMDGDKIGNDTHTLERVASLEFMAKFGRPLFGSLFSVGGQEIQSAALALAQTKLIGASTDVRPGNFSAHQRLACLSQRLALEFDSTTYIDHAQEQKQVADHMRVCLHVEDDFGAMKTVSSSEPLLAEAAARYMIDEGFKPEEALKEVLEEFSINRGDRGELVVLQLFTMARDKSLHNSRSLIIKVDTFMQHLFNLDISSHTPSVWRAKDKETRFEDMMENACMHFNHVVRPHERSVTSFRFLHLIVARGAQILCAEGQMEIDGLVPFLFHDTRIQQSNVGFIIWQVKNDPAFTSTPQEELFKSMNPFTLKLFKKGNEPVPIIRIVFTLAATTPCVTQMKYSEPLSHKFTSFDYWCAGLSATNLKPILEDREATWKALLDASYQWEEMYTGIGQELNQAQYPGGDEGPGFWKNWSHKNDGNNE